MLRQFHEDTSLLRNMINYREDIEKNNISITGIKEECIWLKVEHFDLFSQVGVDIMHDLNEGVIKYILMTVVQRRWKNLRACFSRELRSQKEVKSGQAAPKRKHYVYYEKLLFLIPSMDQPNETFSNAATAPVSEDNEALGEDESSSSSTVTRRAQEKKKKNITYE
ncbi:hypothetical protein ACJJTC_014997 [Scirpophaga incertulas]